jgi:hypothetical protein
MLKAACTCVPSGAILSLRVMISLGAKAVSQQQQYTLSSVVMLVASSHRDTRYAPAEM